MTEAYDTGLTENGVREEILADVLRWACMDLLRIIFEYAWTPCVGELVYFWIKNSTPELPHSSIYFPDAPFLAYVTYHNDTVYVRRTATQMTQVRGNSYRFTPHIAESMWGPVLTAEDIAPYPYTKPALQVFHGVQKEDKKRKAVTQDV